MSWETSHSINDLPIGQRANMQGNISFGFLGVANGDMTTAATASAAAVTANATKHIADQCIGDQATRGFTVANANGFTFGSTTAAFTASGPDVGTHRGRMITG